MVKRLTRGEFDILSAAMPADQRPKLLTMFERIADFVPPQSLAEWKTATNVAGHVFGTKSRGERLVAVDRAYQAWIDNDIKHGGNAENLYAALWKYTGAVGQLGKLAHNYRSERNENNVMTNAMELAGLLHMMSRESPINQENQRKATRRSMLCLLANIKVDWDYKKTLIVGVVGSALGAAELIDPKLTDKITAAVGAGANALGEGGSFGVGVATGVVVGGVAAVAVDDIPGKIKKVVLEQWESFKRWLQQTFTKRFGAREAAELVGMAGGALVEILKIVMKQAASIASGAVDIYEGVRGLIADAWTRSTINFEAEQLVTRDGAFALIAKGIDVGIRNRQIVSAWKIVKGTIKTTVAVTAAAAVKIADLVLGSFEFLFKLLYNLWEIRCISGVLEQANIMWKKIASAGDDDKTASVEIRESEIPKEPPPVGSMPPFDASRYSPYDFLNDKKAAYLHFLHSLTSASPVLAAIYMNGKGFVGARDVFHSVTPRSTVDNDDALKHLRGLEIQAEKLFRDSGFTITPRNTGVLAPDDESYLSKLNAAMLVKSPLQRQGAQHNLRAA